MIPLSELSLVPKLLLAKTKPSSYKFGIPLGRKVLDRLQEATSEGRVKNNDRAIGALLTFDITSRESFDAINGFVEETVASASSNLVIILVGNKSDLGSEY